MNIRHRILTGASAALLLGAPALHAANFTWDGGATLGPQWSRDNNWAGNNAPPSDGTADLFFAGSDRLDAEADSPWSIRSLTFNNGAGAFDIMGSTLTIGIGGITNNGANDQAVFNNIVLAAAQTFNTASTGNLDFFGSVNTNGHLLTVDTSTGVLLRIFDAISGSGGLTKIGTGTVTLTDAANTYSGVTTVNAGRLSLFKAAGVTSIPGTLVLAGGSVSVRADEQITNTSAVTVGSGDTFDLEDMVSETIGALTIGGGHRGPRVQCRAHGEQSRDDRRADRQLARR